LGPFKWAVEEEAAARIPAVQEGLALAVLAVRGVLDQREQ
jgi:hypothetical protein